MTPAATPQFAHSKSGKLPKRGPKQIGKPPSATGPKVLAQNRLQWSTAFDIIHRGVMASGDAFARKGSDYVIPPRPNVGKDTAVSYEIRPSGSLDVVATVTFALGAKRRGASR
jgi:hypothetical protein